MMQAAIDNDLVQVDSICNNIIFIPIIKFVKMWNPLIGSMNGPNSKGNSILQQALSIATYDRLRVLISGHGAYIFHR